MSALRGALSALLAQNAPARSRLESSIDAVLPQMNDVQLTLPCTIGDYTDFLIEECSTRSAAVTGCGHFFPPGSSPAGR